MKRALGLSVAVIVATTVAGCDGRVKIVRNDDVATVRSERGPLKHVARLDCPAQQGRLKRTSAAADGSACAYADDRGNEVDLKLVALGARDPASVLEQERTGLSALLPANEEPEAVDVQELEVETMGESARIRLPGVSVDADDHTATIRVGDTLVIDADEGSDVVRIKSDDERFDVRERDGAHEITAESGENGEVRASYILAAEDEIELGPWRLAGYEARAPRGGPMVLAVVRAKDRRNAKTFDAMKALVERNVGG
jgi:hypothetical protein